MRDPRLRPDRPDRCSSTRTRPAELLRRRARTGSAAGTTTWTASSSTTTTWSATGSPGHRDCRPTARLLDRRLLQPRVRGRGGRAVQPVDGGAPGPVRPGRRAAAGRRSACARSARGTSPRSASPPRSSARATALRSPTAAGPLVTGQRIGAAAPPRPARRRPGRRGLRQRGLRHRARRAARALRRRRLRAGRSATCPAELLLARPPRRTPSSSCAAPSPPSYAVDLPRRHVPLHQRVLWPATPGGEQRHGGRPVRPVHRRRRRAGLPGHLHRVRRPAHRRPDAQPAATCATSRSTPMRGPAARNKGMALFPRPVGGPAPGAVPLRRRDHRPDHASTARTAGRRRPAARAAPRLGADPGRQLRLADGDRRRLAGAHPRRRTDAPVRHRRAAARPGPAGAGHRRAAGRAARARRDRTRRLRAQRRLLLRRPDPRRAALAAVRRQRRPGRLRHRAVAALLDAMVEAGGECAGAG